jgi:hypothetical protein
VISSMVGSDSLVYLFMKRSVDRSFSCSFLFSLFSDSEAFFFSIFFPSLTICHGHGALDSQVGVCREETF